MNIAVLIKPVLDCGVNLFINEKEMTMAQKDQPPAWIVNPADRAALEVALALKKEVKESCVFAVSFVPPEHAEAPYYALARGADRAILIEDDVEGFKDASYVAAVIGGFLARERVDLILCGNVTMDYGTGCVGPFIAEYLNVPQVTGVVTVRIFPEHKKAVAQRRLEKGNRELIECSLPAVFSVEPMIAPLKYVSIHALTSARRRRIETIPLEFHGVTIHHQVRTRLVKLEPPRPRPKRTFIPDSKLSPVERMKLIASGGMVQKKESKTLTGTPESIADGIFSFLAEKGFL